MKIILFILIIYVQKSICTENVLEKKTLTLLTKIGYLPESNRISSTGLKTSSTQDLKSLFKNSLKLLLNKFINLNQMFKLFKF